ncbi:hypothetical protein BJX63DRAFT_265329 [Aspergillus granulosus]|uniref:S-adenosyl-L-methionine-dependent methyltransferase n=1 Tax=Aspergillus granulosus TaxID=176169 RepID=A0ABR4H8R7_9EURO
MPKRPQPAPAKFTPPMFRPRPKYTPTDKSPPEYHDHTMENSRRYRGHKNEFPWPNDDEALKSYSWLNTTWTYLLEAEGQNLISAPVVLHKGTKVLDCGARGTTWMYDVEEKYPGTRIAVIDPGCAWLWPAFVTVHHELEGKWPFTARQSFHYIRGFALGGMIADYDGLYQNAYNHLLPGGWFEVRDHDLQFFVDTESDDEEKEDIGVEDKEQQLVSLRRWERLTAEAADKFGKPINMGAKHKEMMKQAGFTDVQEKVFKIPFGDWKGGKPWEYVRDSYILHMRHGLEGYTLRLFTKTLGWSLENTRAFIREVQAEITEPKLEQLRLYSLFRVVYGKKPTTASRKPEDATLKPERATRDGGNAAKS